MDTTTPAATQSAGRHLDSVPTTDSTESTAAHRTADIPDGPDTSLARRARLRDRHAQRLAMLMDQRRDLRGVHPLADFVDDAIRWTA